MVILALREVNELVFNLVFELNIKNHILMNMKDWSKNKIATKIIGYY